MRRADRDELRAEIRGLLGEAQAAPIASSGNGRATLIDADRARIVSANVRGIER